MTTKAIITDFSSILIVCVTLLIICFGAGYSYAKEQAADRKHELALKKHDVSLAITDYAKFEAENQRLEIVADVFGCYPLPGE